MLVGMGDSRLVRRRRMDRGFKACTFNARRAENLDFGGVGVWNKTCPLFPLDMGIGGHVELIRV